jgi:AraC-like DNA-binding protein
MNSALLAIDHAATAATVQVDAASLSVVALVYLRPLLTEVDRTGADRQALFLGLTLLPEDFNASGFLVSHLEATMVGRRALRLLGDPDQLLGLPMGQLSRPTDCGVLGLGMLAAPTLDHAVALALRYARCAGYLVDLHLQRSLRRTTWIAEPLPDSRDLSPFLVDMTFASIVQMCRKVADANFAPIAVELTRARPADPRPYEDYFRCPVHFGFPRNCLVADRGWFDLALPMANTMSYRLSCDLLEGGTDHAVSLPATGLAVERAIRRTWPRVATPAEVAGSLHLSERSLRRRLAEEGMSFSRLLDESRKARALALLVGRRLSLKAVAIETGFADTGTFRRAFKRWTGGTPNDLQVDPGPASATVAGPVR